MALLNFVKTYEEVADKLNLPEAESGDYVKLIFTKDGHIITHGVDYTPLFSAGKKGLVPGSTGKQTEFIRGNGQWLAITTEDLPIASSIEDAISSGTTTKTILNTQQIISYVNNSFAANDAMRYKGTITYEDGVYTTHTAEGEDVQGFPTKCQIGDTYRVTKQGTYAAQTCEAGDLIICVKDGEGSSLNTLEYWTAVQTNINGQVKHSVNGISIYTYSNSSNTFNIFAPTTGGTQNQILISNGTAAPTWINQNAIKADIADSVKASLLESVSLSQTGEVSVRVGGTTKKSNPASGTWNINITGSASKVANALSTSSGLSMGTSGETYDGSVARTLILLPANSTTIGGVIIDSDSENKTISVTDTGSIYLTRDNIINALGYVPGSSESFSYQTIIGSSSEAVDSTGQVVANPFINLVEKVQENKTVKSSYQIMGLGNIKVSGQNSINISLEEATSENYGGIKIGYQDQNRNYGVKLSEGKAYVTVPWTQYGLATATSDGLVPMFDSLGTGALTAGSWVLSKLANGTYDWFALPETVFSGNTWRPIQVKGKQLLSDSIESGVLNFLEGGHTTISGIDNNITISSTWRDITIGGSSIGDDTLNFIPSGDIYLKADSSTDGIYDISFGLSWYNISTGKYETA